MEGTNAEQITQKLLMLAHVEMPAFTLTVHPLGFEAENKISLNGIILVLFLEF